MTLVERPLKLNELLTYNDADKRYFKISYLYMGNVIRETKIFKHQSNLNQWLNRNVNLTTGLRAWIIEETEE